MCDFPRCRQPVECVYIGKDLCAKHWAMLSDLDGEKEQEMLLKIGLMRDKNREVVRFTEKRMAETKETKDV